MCAKENLHPHESHHFVFFLVPKFTIMSLITALETLQNANFTTGYPLFRWTLCSEDGNPVTSSLGTTLEVDADLNTEHQNATILVVAGGEGVDASSAKVLNWLRRHARFGSAIGGLGAGGFVLAEAGLLDGKKATIHWQYRDSFLEKFPKVELTDATFMVDSARYTTSGGVSAIDLILSIISEKLDEKFAKLVAEQMNYAPIRELQEHVSVAKSERVGIRNPKVSKVVTMMEENVEEPLSTEFLASTVSISVRQLERLFQRTVGEAPKKYYLSIRLGRAQRLLTQTEMSVAEVAVASGFSSLSNFSLRFRQKYNKSPFELKR